MSKELLTPEELVERWRSAISVRQLANWRSLGEGPPYVKIGGRVLYRLQEVEAYEKRRSFSATSEYTDGQAVDEGA